MLNYVWIALMLIAFVVAAINGTAEQVGTAAVTSAKTAVEISIGLVGVMALWLGIMRIAEKAGLISVVARAVAPVLRLLFPEVPRDHPAMGAIILNIAANVLGLSNAATPFGIKAMEELQTLNRAKAVASNAMVMFLALNTASVQLIPTTAIAILVAAGAKKPTVIIGTTLAATSIGTIAAILITKLLERFFPYREEDEVEVEVAA